MNPSMISRSLAALTLALAAGPIGCATDAGDEQPEQEEPEGSAESAATTCRLRVLSEQVRPGGDNRTTVHIFKFKNECDRARRIVMDLQFCPDVYVGTVGANQTSQAAGVEQGFCVVRGPKYQ